MGLGFDLIGFLLFIFDMENSGLFGFIDSIFSFIGNLNGGIFGIFGRNGKFFMKILCLFVL